MTSALTEDAPRSISELITRDRLLMVFAYGIPFLGSISLAASFIAEAYSQHYLARFCAAYWQADQSPVDNAKDCAKHGPLKPGRLKLDGAESVYDSGDSLTYAFLAALNTTALFLSLCGVLSGIASFKKNQAPWWKNKGFWSAAVSGVTFVGLAAANLYLLTAAYESAAGSAEPAAVLVRESDDLNYQCTQMGVEGFSFEAHPNAHCLPTENKEALYWNQFTGSHVTADKAQLFATIALSVIVVMMAGLSKWLHRKILATASYVPLVEEAASGDVESQKTATLTTEPTERTPLREGRAPKRRYSIGHS